MPPPWVIVETRPAAEDAAERSLRLAGYRVYLPRYRCLVHPHGRSRSAVTVLRPIFPRLVCVQDWRGWPAMPINCAIGLLSFQAGIPAGLSDSDVALIMDRERNREFDETPLASRYKVGDAVEIEMLEHRIMGVLERLSPDGKATVSAMLLGRTIRTHVPVQRLHVVSS
jgi:hypothetical protein